MIWSAVLVHLKGLALAFQSLIHSSSAQVSSSREQKTPRSRRRRCSSANHRSTWLSHEEYVGVKCSANRGCASSHRWTARALWAERLSQITWTARLGADLAVDVVQERLEVLGAVLRGGRGDDLAGGDVQRREQVDRAVPVVVVA